MYTMHAYYVLYMCSRMHACMYVHVDSACNSSYVLCMCMHVYYVTLHVWCTYVCMYVHVHTACVCTIHVVCMLYTCALCMPHCVRSLCMCNGMHNSNVCAYNGYHAWMCTLCVCPYTLPRTRCQYRRTASGPGLAWENARLPCCCFTACTCTALLEACWKNAF